MFSAMAIRCTFIVVQGIVEPAMTAWYFACWFMCGEPVLAEVYLAVSAVLALPG